MPNRIRLASKIALVLTLLAPLAFAQQQQNNNAGGRNGGGPGGGGPGGGWGGPGGGGPGGGWGGPGGGGPGGFGGGPGGGTSPTSLIQNPIVQDDLKMTDKQKEQVKQVNADAEKKRVQVQEKAQKLATAARVQAAQDAAAEAEANGGTPFNANGNNGNGNNGNNGGGRGNRGGGRNDAGAQIMRQTMDEFSAQVETALLKVLEPKQKTRIKQIALQAEGAGAFNNPEVIEKLALTEEQVAAIEAIRNDSRQSGRQLMGQLFNNGNNNNGGGPGGGGPGGGGPGGGGGRGGPDPATVATPEFQAKLKSVQDGQQKLDDQTMVSVGKALTKAQRATFQKMVGEKFDVAQLRQGFLNRFRPAGTPATPTQTASAATPAAATPAAAPAATTTTTPAKEAAKPAARKSLREARGGTTQP